MPRTLLRKLLKKFSKNFQNFNSIGFWVLLLRGTDFGAAVCRAAISGCSEPHSASEMRTFSLSPLPDRNGRKLVDDRAERHAGRPVSGECYLRPRGFAPNPT